MIDLTEVMEHPERFVLIVQEGRGFWFERVFPRDFRLPIDGEEDC